MACSLNMFSSTKDELNLFLSKFFNSNIDLSNNFAWQKIYPNPVEMVDLIGVYIDNIDDFQINLWLCLDSNVFIRITPRNAEEIIKYIFERYPL